jgi:uncharacterized coiled-coil protein SlyX
VSDIDQNLLEILSTTYLSQEKLAEDLQRHIDEQVQDAVSDLELSNAAQRQTIKAMSTELGKTKKSLDLAQKAHVTAIGDLYRIQKYLTSVRDHPSRLVRFLVKRADWPRVPTKYAATKLEAVQSVLAELHRQDVKWGSARQHPNGTGPRFNFDAGLADHYKKVTDENFAAGRGTWADILTEEFYEAMAEENPRKLKVELIQVAAVAVAWVVSLTLQKKK